MRFYLTACVLAFMLVQSAKSDGLDNFVQVKLANYSNWLKDNNLDPSPLESGPTYFWSANILHSLHTTIENYGIKGHSGQIQTNSVESDLSALTFTVNFTVTENVTFYGDYNLNGSFPTSGIIHSNGTWNITVPSVSFNLFTITFAAYPDTGNLNISSFNLSSVDIAPEDGYDILFENLLDQPVGNYPEMGLGTLFRGFIRFLNEDPYGATHPTFRRLYLQYWTEVLAETTLADIIDTPEPPTTTPPPCLAMFPENGEEFVYLGSGEIVEKTVEKESGIDSDGVPVIITKSVLVTKERRTEL